MPDRRDVIYCYDGSFDGLICCVFESYVKDELPSDICSEEPEQLSLLEIRYIETDTAHSERVLRGIAKRNCSVDFIKQAFLTCVPKRDILILDYIRKLFSYGRKAEFMLADDTVNALNKAVYHCTHEAHLLKGFVRFSEYGGVLAAVISPKNKVIPLLADHFADRLGGENFFIYDDVHRMAFVHIDRRGEILENIDFELPPPDRRERGFRGLWREFYDAIEISERENPRCRMNNMPKRFWENMTEMNRSDTAAKAEITQKNSPLLTENSGDRITSLKQDTP